MQQDGFPCDSLLTESVKHMLTELFTNDMSLQVTTTNYRERVCVRVRFQHNYLYPSLRGKCKLTSRVSRFRADCGFLIRESSFFSWLSSLLSAPCMLHGLTCPGEMKRRRHRSTCTDAVRTQGGTEARGACPWISSSSSALF